MSGAAASAKWHLLLLTSQHVLQNIGEQLQASFVTALQKIFNCIPVSRADTAHMLILVIYFNNDMSAASIWDFLGNCCVVILIPHETKDLFQLLELFLIMLLYLRKYCIIET